MTKTKAQKVARGPTKGNPQPSRTASKGASGLDVVERMTVMELRAFVLAVIDAIGEISKQEAGDAICREWDATFGIYR